MSKAPIAILGAGNMASALALNLARHKRPVRLYCIEADVEADMRANRCNAKYLAGHRFPKHVTASPDIAEVLKGAEDIFIAVPSFAVAEVMTLAKPFLGRKIKSIASITKGLDEVTLKPLVMSEANILSSELRNRVCTLGGPAIAKEMAAGSPTGFVIAGREKSVLQRVKKLLETQTVKCATSTDLIGVGMASALKNPYAIALGFCDGLQYPTNAKAMMLAIAVEEMEHVILNAGGHIDTAAGLAGLGDLIVTGMSPHGRNRTYGERLVGAKSKVPSDLGLGTVEGIAATGLAVKLARRLKIKTPLLDTIDRCLRSKHHFEQPFVHYLKHLQLP
ncbi:NAD(P)H-dependent glycerol-3-phosphate dehydrogenase [Candidatus Uhrbacteria bacterium]|jgi:glycerol-3-phosphate dehydrogenase (NAD(P)+)|nr:MAG: NAD(P)H-dependent glycerol-3-phosphate dehydrogenase [Candidatus Uhrbacteria bacterium]